MVKRLGGSIRSQAERVKETTIWRVHMGRRDTVCFIRDDVVALRDSGKTRCGRTRLAIVKFKVS